MLLADRDGPGLRALAHGVEADPEFIAIALE
jgi:hypothetical protein